MQTVYPPQSSASREWLTAEFGGKKGFGAAKYMHFSPPISVIPANYVRLLRDQSASESAAPAGDAFDASFTRPRSKNEREPEP